ncbi:splicing regulator RBM11 [Leptodactylus fuscus]|uniref:splicing regulator RBM11 n=1 Tax=Leptodactylus fuscus TaxID=238119 RepID=UPI003F4F0CAF
MLKRQEEADRTIFVGNLDCNVKEEILYELFLQAGPLTKVTIAKDKEGNLKSFGFVCFKHTESVPYAIALLNGIRLFGRPIKLQYRFGSSYSGEASNVFQGPDNGFVANQADYGVPVMGEPFTPGLPMPHMDSSYFSEACYYFNGMMNQVFAFQHLPFGAAAPEPPPCRTTHPWNKETFPPFSEPTQNVTPGPSSQGPNLNVLYEHKSKSSRARKRRRKAKSSDSENDNLEESKSSHKPKKRKKSKRRKP